MADKKKCTNPAYYKYTWPGKDEAYCCLPHANQIGKVAKAMRLHLQFIPLTQDEYMQLKDCESEEAKP